MGYNKFITKGREVIFDISNVTVTAEKLSQGSTAVDKTGTLITGVMEGPKSACLDVEALPTENIDTATIYRLTDSVSEKPEVYFVEDGYPTLSFADFIVEVMGAEGSTVVITQVAQLPEAMTPTDLSRMDTIIYLYVNESDGIAYLLGDFEGTGENCDIMTAGQLANGPDKGWTDDVAAETELGVYCVRGASYSVYHLWVYNEDKWFELLNTFEVTELPIEDIASDVCYILVAADGKKQYFMYNNGVWVEYSSGGGEEFINYISGVDVETFELPKDIESIAAYACYGRGYKAVIIPNTVKTIGENAFLNCSELTDVYFTGSEDEWNAITVNAGNDVLTNATKTYNYEKNS